MKTLLIIALAVALAFAVYAIASGPNLIDILNNY